jgi:hypothetical protein
MPKANLFRHQAYTNTRPISPHHRISPEPPPGVESELFCRRMEDVGATLQAEGVRAVILAHGTFVGPDSLGVLSELARAFPKASETVRPIIKRILDRLSGDVGNYTVSYARLFEASISRGAAGRTPVELFHWSSENHHIGRADGAVRLIARLAALKLQGGERVLLWGHSHAGNVFALVTNLLSGHREAARRFFEAAAIYYRWPVFGCVDIPLWTHVRDLLLDDDSFMRDVGVDIVTFGTPVRYGWDCGGYSRLLHFINRRPAPGAPEYRATFPVKLDDVLNAAEGDYVQQLGIAGTNIVPSVSAWRAWAADRKLNALLQSDPPMGATLDRFRAGRIVPDDGTTLLVDYGQPKGGIGQHLAGHAVYTRKQWLLFHAEEVVRRFYSARACRAA